jgi:transposase
MPADGARDGKEEALRRTRTLNPRPDAVADDAFGPAGFFDARDMAQVKYEMVRKARSGEATVSAAAALFGLSRPSFYAAARALDADGLAGLVPARPGPRRGHKLTPEVVGFAAAAKERDPSLSAAGLAGLVEERFGVRVHPRSVERALARASNRGGRP